MGTSPSRSARLRLWRVTAAAVTLVLVAPASQSSATIPVTVAGRQVSLDPDAATVAAAVERASVRVRVAMMRSVGSGTPIDAETRDPTFMRSGRPVRPSTRLRAGDRVEIVTAADWVEPTVVRRVVRHASPLPPVETQLWHQSHDGVVEQVAGQFSGEVLEERVIEPARPAAPSGGREVVLTFDDGPDHRWTPMVLDILRARGVKAVFCMVGSQMRRYPDLVRRVHAEGHVLCNHTDSHDVRLPERAEARIRAEMDAVTALMVELTGTRPRFYRGPGGRLSPFIVAHAQSQQMRVLGWSVDSLDYRKPGAQAILDRVATAMHPAAVALLHDAGGDRSQTVAQLPALLERLSADGYAVAVP